MTNKSSAYNDPLTFTLWSNLGCWKKFILNNSNEMKKYTVIPRVDTVKVRKEPPYEE